MPMPATGPTTRPPCSHTWLPARATPYRVGLRHGPSDRRYVDDGYRFLVFPLDELRAPDFTVELSWSLADLLGYLRTWSPVRRFIEAHGRDPVDDIEAELASAWGDASEEKPVH